MIIFIFLFKKYNFLKNLLYNLKVIQMKRFE